MEQSNGYPHAEPRGRKAYLNQYVPVAPAQPRARRDAPFPDPSGEPARMTAGNLAAKCVATALARSSAIPLVLAREYEASR